MKKTFWLGIASWFISGAGLVSGDGVERANPMPDIKANGSSQEVTISRGFPLNIAINLAPGNLNGTRGDWWVYAQSPMGDYYYNYSEGWLAGEGLTHQGPMLPLPPTSILRVNTLPKGSYRFIFRVDATPNGSMETGYVDEVSVNIVSSTVNTFINGIGMTFTLIPAGTYTMGSPKGELGRVRDEIQHQVILTKPFYMQTTEVTQGQWQTVMGSNPARFLNCGQNCPVENVSWKDVQDFIATLNAAGQGTYRLPTEAEWEYAARANRQAAYSFGDTSTNLELFGWYYHNAWNKSHPVARKLPNPWGLYDVHGNVWEWVQDWYGKYPAGSVTDPTGPESGANRVLRGGSWYDSPINLRSAYRGSDYPAYRSGDLGFRLVKDYP